MVSNKSVEIPSTTPLKCITVSIQEVIDNNYRLDANSYGGEGRQARMVLADCKWGTVNLCGKGSFATAYRGARFKMIGVEKSAYPFYQPAQINEIHPKPSAYMSVQTQTDIDALRVKKGQVLLTCSGTIGNCTYVRNTLDNLIFSGDVIRIKSDEYSGFIYAYLKSQIGFTIINTAKYGAVISHIDPNHLNNVPIPNPPASLKREIHNLIEKSFRLRDESNNLIDEAQSLLKDALRLPGMYTLHKRVKRLGGSGDLLAYPVPVNKLDGRLDASYHVPIVQTIERHLKNHAKEVTIIDDERISRLVIMPGRFKRVYVAEGNGVVFFGGKQIFELDPNNKKYLSLAHHEDRIKNQLTLRENMTMITSSGTIGKVTIVPSHWQGWTANQHIIRVVPANNSIAGYLYAWLSSDYAYPLITRYTHGAVIDEINGWQVSQIAIPLLKDENAQKTINNMVLQANQKRAKAYHLEQDALAVLNEKIIYAR